MKKLLRFLLWLAGTAIFLLATAHFTLRHLLNTPKFKAAATGFIERTTGRPADYGRIDYELFPFSLVVRNASLQERDGGPEFASIRSFSAAVDFRNKEISSLRIDRPTLRIVQRADGSYNFSDLISAPPAGTATAAGGPAQPPSGPRPEVQPTEPPFVLRRVQIDGARFEFIRQDAENGEESFTLSNLDFFLRDFAPDQPFRMEGRAAIGRSSSVQFELSGPAFADYADQPGAWPMNIRARLDVLDFADLKAFLPPDTLPFQSLEATLAVQGAIADHLDVQLDLRTPAATETHPVALDCRFHAELALPPPVAQHVLGGAPLPDGFRFAPPPCAPPPGTLALTETAALAPLLKHAQGKAEFTFLKIAYGSNLFEQGSVLAYLRDGVLTIPAARCSVYGGTIEARGNAQLLACPLSYQLERLAADHLAIGQALAANGLGDFAAISGTLHLEASASGQAVAEPAFRTLAADAKMRIENLQTVGTGGSLMDQVWLQLDNPLLLQLVPRVQAKVEQAKQAAATTTTSRYDTATATLALRDGIATLSDARLALPDYRLEAAGTILPFDDRLDLAAKLIASPAETAKLTDGKDRSAYLPYEDGGLMVPLAIRSPLHDPRVVPDLDLLLKNALAGASDGEAGSVLDELSDSDRKNVEKGLEILGSFLKP